MVAPVPEPAQDQTSPPANSRIWLLTAFVTVLITAVFAAVLRFSSLPLGVTGEWVWPRIPADQVDLFSLVFSVFAVGIYLALWERSRRRIAETNRLDWQAALVILLAAILLPIWFRSIPFGIYGTSGMPWVTYFPRMSGYFSAAVESEGKLQQELAGYEGLVAQGDYLHEGTHPPGLLIYFSGLNSLCKSSPVLTDFLLWTSGPELREGLDVLTEPPHQLTLPQRAA
ncbi:MAG: hypothetical protein KDA78_18540, partial [Planctomycetaceae bacterium]|nr:hypothetical protein [Planctomycetaceae bacterium]